MQAIIQQGKSQYIVSEGDVIQVDKLDLDPKKKLDIEKVLLVTKDGKASIGQPYVKDAKVTATVVEHGKGEKVINFRYKKKKGYHRTVGHRQQYTELQINNIESK